VFFGMLGVTFFGLLLTPVFYVLLRKLAGGKQLKDKHGNHLHIHGPDDYAPNGGGTGGSHGTTVTPQPKMPQHTVPEPKVPEPALQD
jgi:multidrug efflux pump